MTDALWGFTGTIVGAAVALLTTVLSLRHARQLQVEQWEREAAERSLTSLKQAYFEFFAAFHRANMEFLGMLALPKDERDALASRLIAAMKEEATVFGAKVRLLEPCALARSKTADLLESLATSLGTVAASEHRSFMANVATLNAPIVQLGAFEVWLVDERFAPAYSPRKQPLTGEK